MSTVVTINVYSCNKQRLLGTKDKYLGNIPKTLSYHNLLIALLRLEVHENV